MVTIEADYIVLQTGYTARLIPDAKKYSEMLHDELDVHPLYIYDHKQDHEFQKGMRERFSSLNNLLKIDGFVIIELNDNNRSRPMRIVSRAISIVQDYDMVYCGSYAFDNIDTIKLAEVSGIGTLLIVDFDFESG